MTDDEDQSRVAQDVTKDFPTLDHEEHATIDLPPGAYRVVVQREYVPAQIGGRTWRKVVD